MTVIRLSAKLSALLTNLEADGGPPLDFGLGHARVWQAFIFDPRVPAMPQVDRQLYALAVHQGLTVVEYRHRYSDALTKLGVRLHILD